MKSKVILIPCDSYEEEKVYGAVSRGLKLLEEDGPLIDPAEKVLLKPNLLSKATPDKAITTHPAVFSAVARYLRETGREKLFYGDGPGEVRTEIAARDAGILAAAGEQKVVPADFEDGKTVAFPQGTVAKEFFLANGVLEADAIVNLCKMKTHMLERVTGAVKNSYGFVPGNARKKEGHMLYPNAEQFAAMLCDLNRCVTPRFAVMDGITAMEGNGPASGDPVAMNVLLFSRDPVALDTVFCRLVYLPPDLVATNTMGARCGLGVGDESEIGVLTPEGVLTPREAGERYGKADFNVYRKRKNQWTGLLLEGAMRPFSRRPFIRPEKCTRCGTCVRACPVEGGAVNFRKEPDRPPVFQYSKCIRCFCCQELCPQRAINVRGIGWNAKAKGEKTDV